MAKCSHHQYFYHASASGLSAEIERPVQQSIAAQAASTLPSGGGRGFQRTEKFCVAPFVCFDAAYSEVGGSFDECHMMHTTYAYSVIEGLNIADVVTADRVVSRIVTYSPPEPAGHCCVEGEHTFDITGSHFDNLRIAGHKVEFDLSSHLINEHNTYSKFQELYHPEAAENGAGTTAKASSVKSGKGGTGERKKKAASLLPWGDQDQQGLNRLLESEETYHALVGIGTRAKAWANGAKSKSAARPAQKSTNGGAYWCSAAGHLDLKKSIGDTELQNFGGLILIPKFGVVRLAELVIHPDYQRLTMVRVQMCSGSTGSTDGGTTGTSGGRPPKP